MILTPIRIEINKMMDAMPRSCTGWCCSCKAPNGFGEGRNKICLVYGPGIGVTQEEYDKYIRSRRAAVLRLKWKNKENLQMNIGNMKAKMRQSENMEKKRGWLDWELDFEDQCRTQGFFEARERQRAYEADAPARAERESWERYREAELESSCRSIRTLHYDDC